MSFRSTPLALIQLLLPSAGAYPCMCQIGEKGLVELRDVSSPSRTSGYRPYFLADGDIHSKVLMDLEKWSDLGRAKR